MTYLKSAVLGGVCAVGGAAVVGVTPLMITAPRLKNSYFRPVPVCPAPEAERVLDGEQQMQVLEAALDELSPKCRAVFEQFHFEGRSQKDIADEQGISVSMVEKYVRQAVNHCQKRLTESTA